VYLKLYHDPEGGVLGVPENEGIEQVMDLLEEARQRGVEVEMVDARRLSQEDLTGAYGHAVIPSVWKRVGIRRVFGTRRNSAAFFGKGVPALLVYEGGEEYPSDVYPHREGSHVITIREFLKSLLAVGGSGTAEVR